MTRSVHVILSAVASVLLVTGTAFAGTAVQLPEPASLTLLAAGGIGLYLAHRRRNKK